MKFQRFSVKKFLLKILKVALITVIFFFLGYIVFTLIRLSGAYNEYKF